MTMTTTTNATISALQQKAVEYGLTDRFNKVLSVKGQTFVHSAKAFRDTTISYLMGVNSSHKSQKNEKFGYISGVLYLAAHLNSGVNICPAATSGCSKACLYFTGRNALKTSEQKISATNAAQFLKTALFFINRNYFMDWLDTEIASLDRNKGNNIPCIRLNGTSDINITTFKNSKGQLLVEKYSHIQFYDYTKVVKYLENEKRFPNYDLTFSYGGPENLFETLQAIENGFRVSVPFDKQTFNGAFPERLWGRICVDGDQSDLTFTFDKNVIYALKAKVPHHTKVGYNTLIKGNDFFVNDQNIKTLEQ